MSLRRLSSLSLAAGAALALSASVLGAFSAPAQAAVGDDVIAWVEVEDGQISGGPALNSGDHGNFSGSGSYTFRETGMQSTMTVTAPVAGTYPVYIRYAAGPLGAGENVTRSMGLLTNNGARQSVSYPMTSMENWEAWDFATATVNLNQGTNTIAVQCDRGQDFCRLNFDAIQVGGKAPDPCVAVAPTPGYASLFDGTFETFDGWRKAAGGGFGRQTDCTMRTFRGRGATWLTTPQTGPYTLKLDWRRTDAADESRLYVGSATRGGADPDAGFAIPIGTRTAAIDPANGATGKEATASAVAAALKPVGQWNTYSVQVTSSLVRVALNGTVVNTYVNPGNIPLTGHIGLENRGAGHDVSFRNVQIKQGTAPDTVDSTTTVTAAPTALTTGQGTSSVTVAVASSGAPTGQVDLYVDGAKHSTVTLAAGSATATVGPFATAGAKTVEARYLGDTATNPSTGRATLTVTDPVVVLPPAKAPAKVMLKVAPSKVIAKKTAAKLTVRVTAPGVTPSGKVRVKVGAKTYTATLKAGKATIKLAKFAKPGTVRATATYAGDAATDAATGSTKISVKKAPAPKRQ